MDDTQARQQALLQREYIRAQQVGTDEEKAETLRRLEEAGVAIPVVPR